MIVNQTNFYFHIRHKAITFVTAMDLVRYLADEKYDDHILIQSRVGARLNADVVAKDWKKRRTRLGELKHFPRYRGNLYDKYHAAARARQVGNATQSQLTLANGLENEIRGSKVAIPAGQVLFHGRANRDLDAQQPYPSFVSTSLDPVVGRNSAMRRAGVDQVNGRPVVYVLTTRAKVPALWGHVGKSFEYEILLGPGNTFVVRSTYSGRNFEVVKADLA